MATWSSEPIHVAEGLVVEVTANRDGVTVTKHVDGVFAADLLLTADQADRLAKAITEGSAHSRAMKGE